MPIYRLGLLGDSQLAGLICDWVHPHFGCDLTHLAITFDAYGNDMSPHGTYATPFYQLRTCRDLEALMIVDSRLDIDDIEAIASLPRLKQLSLRGCRLPPKAIVALGKLPQLESLDLTDCLLDEIDLEGIEQFKNLTNLSLADNLIGDDALARLTKLERLAVLNLADTDVTDDGLVELIELAQLSDLTLAKTPVSTDCVETLLEMPALRYVNFYRCSHINVSTASKRVEELGRQTRIDFDWTSYDQDVAEWDFEDNRPGGTFGNYLPNVFYTPSGGGQF